MADTWSGDYLGRKEDAELLIPYLLDQNKQALQGDRGISINVSAPWGAGKTYFVTNISAQLRESGYRVAFVNAWRDDHAEDPLFPVISAVLNALGAASGPKAVRKALTENAGKIAVRTAKGLATRAAAVFVTKEAVDGILDDVTSALAAGIGETAGEFADKAIKRFEEGQAAIAQFRKELTKAVQGTKPLFVVVDELDRCRPTYAISLLERLKHLFDVPNIIFIIATNTNQLAHTIRAVYGTAFDADRYLLRFFDRTYTFDAPALDKFIEERWRTLKFSNNRYQVLRDYNHAQTLAIIAEAFDLSLRDIGQCLAILRSLEGFWHHDVAIPLLYVFPLIAAYQQGNFEAFRDVAGRKERANEADFQINLDKVYPKTGIFRFEYYENFGGGKKIKEEFNLNDVYSCFIDIIKEGIVNIIQSKSRISRYVEEYRNQEFNILHNGRYNIGEKVESILVEFPSLIQKAGRFSIGKQVAERV